MSYPIWICHSSILIPEILKAMNRPWQGQVNDAIINRLKETIPDAVLRTTFIVGYPWRKRKRILSI